MGAIISSKSTATNCITLQHTATHCYTLQLTATHCNTLQQTVTHCNTLREMYCMWVKAAMYCNILQRAVTHCDSLQHIWLTTTYFLMHCINIPQMPNQLESCPPISLQHTATRCNTLQVIASHCNSLQLTATHCNSLQLTATHCNTLQHICNALQQPTTDAKSAGKLSSDDFVKHCNTLQHTATHCNILQHAATTYHRCQISRKAVIRWLWWGRKEGGSVQSVVWTRSVTATHYNTLQHTATHCNTLQHTATHGNARQHTATHWNTRGPLLQPTTTPLQHNCNATTTTAKPLPYHHIMHMSEAFNESCLRQHARSTSRNSQQSAPWWFSIVKWVAGWLLRISTC